MTEDSSATSTETGLRWQGLAAVADGRTRALVLGSFPGLKSLQQAQYYAHPQNQFWRLLGSVLDWPELAALAYEDRLAGLLARTEGQVRLQGQAIHGLPAHQIARLGLGYVRAHYDRYDCPRCGEWKGKGDKNYLGVTKAAISLIYVIK